MVTSSNGREAIRVWSQGTESLAGSVGVLPPSVCKALHAPGQPLPPDLRAFFERHFRCSFGQVQLHTDAGAAVSAQAMGTLAYTVGSHIVFGEGRFAPWTPEGKALLAHELTHVVQQRHARTIPLHPVQFNSARDASEQEADDCARVIMGAPRNQLEVRVVQRTHGVAFQGWWTEKDAAAHGVNKKYTHQALTREILGEVAFSSVFGARSREDIIYGSAHPDDDKTKLKRGGHTDAEIGEKYHGWGPSPARIQRYIDLYVYTAANQLNYEGKDRDYCLKWQLGKALHAAQDKAAHSSFCLVSAWTCDSERQDCPDDNWVGWGEAKKNTRKVLQSFLSQLTEDSRKLVKSDGKANKTIRHC